MLSINNRAQRYIAFDENIINRATVIEKMGFTTYDAMHIACAETACVDSFLSTDDKLVKNAYRNKNKLFVTMQNPLNWLQEELKK